MKNKCLRIPFVLMSMFSMIVISCEIQKPDPPVEPASEENLVEQFFRSDVVRVKFAESIIEKVESGIREGEDYGSFLPEDILSLGVAGLKRTFPYAGRFEERTRAEGLHRWYDIYLDGDAAVTKVNDVPVGSEDVSVVEMLPKIKITDGSRDMVLEYIAASEPASDESVFDDPMLVQQWHYCNDGSLSGAVAGADINVLPVWKDYTSGSEDVIVCVVDGGIDYSHEDLADNMWYEDIPEIGRIHGYNFVRDSYDIIPSQHATHVAGTVAAVNNNGKGVCGVAGGDKKKGIKGARLMNCQINEDGSSISGSGARAIKWGADHGAVISQNSWGYSSSAGLEDTPQSDKEAIDYFIKYAGMDENGVQTGPMAGGVVIFAAGNDRRKICYPAAYEPCVSVSAISSDFEAASYTNYGDWIDIIAPGGDARKDAFIYSTFPGNRYGKLQGTSMACPHVSGIAALLVSRFGGKGFTYAQLRKIMESSLSDISEYTPYMTFGKGLIDTYKAVRYTAEQ